MTRAEEILFFWFADPRFGPLDPIGRIELWFGARAEIDHHIRATFGGDLERARRGELDAWAATPRGRLALLLVLDQLPRNIHRGTPAAFADDPRGLALAREGIAAGADRALDPVERVFFYLPFEHAESARDQARCVRLHEQLLAEASADLAPFLRIALGQATAHHEVIQRFGRFPHRNAILGRASTPEEVAFLVNGPTWGQRPPPAATRPDDAA